MFIGHFTIAYILISNFPSIPPLILLIGVSFPDLLWPFLILLGLEKAYVDPSTPLQKSIQFTKYPFSHSLLLGTAIACIPGFIIGYFVDPLAGILFVMASASHWLLDTITHIQDLPILGFTTSDKKVGFGLWKYLKMAFIIEFIFYALVTILVMKAAIIVPLLILGIIFHLINANSFLGITKTNPFKTSRAYAIITLIGFTAFNLLANGIINGL